MSQRFDVIVIGGGPSGLMAAIAARIQGANTIVLEKGNKLARKLGISGGGRCNVTNAKPMDELMKNIPGNGRFLYSALSQFSNQEIIAFFESLGIRLKEEDRGRVFPITDKASTVVHALIEKVADLGIVVRQDTPVKELIIESESIAGVTLQSGETVLASSVIVATGGCSVPQTGSTGDAYPWASALGHTIVTPYPTEVPLTSPSLFITSRALQGLSFKDATITIQNGRGKVLTKEYGDFMFTHFGLTGPIALRCSHYVSTALRKDPEATLDAIIDFFPEQSAEQFVTNLKSQRTHDGAKQINTRLAEWLPDRLVSVILEESGVLPTTTMAHLGNEAINDVTGWIKRFRMPISGTLPLEKATVTGGGVSIKEVVPHTMASKLCAGLYFAGEVLDVHAHTGGYNITVAFSTGHAAGIAAASYAESLHTHV